MSGRMLGHYEVLEKLGEGGMGVVYRAFDTQLRREVAIKVLPERSQRDQQRLLRFEREALLLASLNHPNIVSIYSVERNDDGPFIVMEVIDGKPLSKVIPQDGMEVKRFLKLAVQLADAVGAAHAHGVQHRDLKPSNIMITTDDKLKITDFGLARFLDPVPDPRMSSGHTPTLFGTRDGVVLGTAAYMSPEQAEGKPTDPRSDIFSIGIVMYEMITGKLPFEGDSQAAVISSILRDTPAPVAQVRPAAPRHLSRIIDQCLEKEADLRFQVAHDLRNSLVKLEEEVKSGRVYAEPRRRPRVLRTSSRNLLIVAACFVLLAVLFLAYQWWGGAWNEELSVAVLPLKNLSPSPGDDYIGDGVTEDIISQLSMFPDFTVISSTSVMRYKGSTEPPAKIGRELGVTHLLEGSFRREGDQLRIVTRLVEAASEHAVWAASFDRHIQGLFALQSEVSMNIVSALTGELSESEKSLMDKPEPSWEAHDLYLRGRHFLGQRTEQGMRAALDRFQRATELAPDYALAWAAIAETFSLLGTFGLEPTLEAHERAYEAAQRALVINADSAEANYALGVAAFNRWEWPTAERSLIRALELNPNLAGAHHYYAYYLVTRGRSEEAIEHILTARRLDPASPTTQLAVGAVYYLSRRYSEAIEHIETSIEMYPESARAHAALAGVCAFTGRRERAREELAEALRLGPRSPEIAATEVTVLALTGQELQANVLLREMENGRDTRPMSPGDAASGYAILGDRRKAIEWLEVAYQERDPVLAYIAADPGFDALRTDPDFINLLGRVGLGS